MKDIAGSASSRWSGGFWQRRGLIGFAVAGAMIEAGVLLVVAPAARPLSPQVTGVAPLALYHDMRWLFGYHRSWLGFAVGAVTVLLVRSAANTVLVRLAWPRELPNPRIIGMFWSNVALAALTGVLISPVVALVFGVAVLPFSWPFLPAVLALMLIVLPLSHGGVLGCWWQALPPLRAVGWVLADFVFLSAASAVIALLPAPAALPAAALAGLVNARAWYGLTAAAATGRPRVSWRPAAAGLRALNVRAPVAPLAAVMVVVSIAGMTRLVFAAAAGRPEAMGVAALPAGIAAAARSAGLSVAAPDGVGTVGRGAGTGGVGRDVTGPSARAGGGLRGTRAVLVVEGFGSSCCRQVRALQQASPGMIVQQFSYLGLDAVGLPLPHGPAPSNLPLPLLGDRIAAQVAQLHQETGEPVDLLAESEGTLGVYAMLARHPHAPIGSIVLASPIVDPGQASFPPGGRQGRSVASGYVLRAMAQVIGRLSPYGPSGAVTLIDSVSRFGARYVALASRHWPARWLAVIPLADAVTLPVCTLPPGAVVVTGFHGGLLGRPNIQRMVRDFVTGHHVQGGQQLKGAAEILAATAAGWRMPATTPPPPPCHQ